MADIAYNVREMIAKDEARFSQRDEVIEECAKACAEVEHEAAPLFAAILRSMKTDNG